MPSLSPQPAAHRGSLSDTSEVLVDMVLRSNLRQAFPLPASGASQGEDGHLCFLLDALEYVSKPKL